MAGPSNSDDKDHLFTGAEMEFCAEDELISIVPNFACPPMELMSGTFGPFRPQIPVQVPLWLAIALHTRGKCVIQPPEWLNVENLKKVLEEERESQGAFQPLPFHYMEISQLLMKNAPNDIPDRFQVCTLIEDLKDVRFHKIESGLQQLTGKRYAVKLNNLGAMELNIIRPFLTKSLEHYFRLDKEDDPAPPPPVPQPPRQAPAPDQPPQERVLRRNR
eukprot:TRINITY_DN4302_c2_g2_i2.p1 TRINITY_DN4302_c2_g2~~TRINITY_DN4302_c2_g2_i2.p1  ORF type:complete len:218 (+),score=48.75 TRINITY_DN4302_c2_g2_i2:49-702(+)